MFGVLSKFFQFSGEKNSNKFKHSIVLGLIEALASAMRIPAIMYILMGIMGVSIVISVLCKMRSTVLQTEGGYDACAFKRIEIAEHLRYLPMGYFNTNSIGEISSVTTNTMESLGDVATRVVMQTTQGILETSMIILMILVYDWRIGLIALAGVSIFFVINTVMQKAGRKESERSGKFFITSTCCQCGRR